MDFTDPLQCRMFIEKFRLDGEKIGYLVNSQTGKETPIEDATEDMLMKAAIGLYEMSKNKGTLN